MLWGTIPATPGYEDRPVIGFISHVDTSPDMSGANINRRLSRIMMERIFV